jgi:CBS domain containing-hemolysin-like protein
VADFVALAIIAALILLNGLFVAAEFAVVAAPRVAIERRAREGQRVARMLLGVLADPRRQDRFIATAQLGITFASLGLGMYGEHVVAAWFAGALESLGAARYIAAHAAASVLAVLVLTYFHIVVGEMVPKSLALQRAEQTLLGVGPIMRALRMALHPLVIGLSALGNLTLALVGVTRQAVSQERYYTPEELQLVVRESHEAGVLTGDARRILSSILDFGERTLAEVMVPRVKVTGIPLGLGPAEVQTVLRESPKSRYPVYEGDLDHIAGVVHVKDLFRLQVAGAPVTEDAVRPMPILPETALLDQALATMRRARTHMALVVDEYGGVAGIVTLEDLVEEVVGEIRDEVDAVPEIRVERSGALRVLGTVRLHEIGERLERELEHPDVDSVSGLVMTLVGRAPQVGDAVTYSGLRFEVAAVEGFGVSECVVWSPDGRAPDA